MRVVSAALGLALIVPAGALAHEPPRVDRLERKVERLQGKVAKQKARAERFRDQRDAARDERDAAVVQRDQALAGLPDAIRAVPIDDFWRLVFQPSIDTWPCDHYSEFEGGRWMLTFDHPYYCS